MKLTTRYVAKPWGRSVLPRPFVNPGTEQIGELWFEPETGPALPLMVKFLFTSEKLSIQVHPSDAQAHARGLVSGKEECWLVLDAEPDAVLGIGTTCALSGEELRAAALSGEIEALMDWKPVQTGDFYYIPAGTVHAIGAGVSLVEIQQNADITYRLYDYGRPRELHLNDGVSVSQAVPYADPLQRHIALADDHVLVDGPLFRVTLGGVDIVEPAGTGPLLIVPLRGSVETLSGIAEVGECLAVSDNDSWAASDDARLLLARAV